MRASFRGAQGYEEDWYRSREDEWEEGQTQEVADVEISCWYREAATDVVSEVWTSGLLEANGELMEEELEEVEDVYGCEVSLMCPCSKVAGDEEEAAVWYKTL